MEVISATDKRAIIRLTTNYDPAYVRPIIKEFMVLLNYSVQNNLNRDLQMLARRAQSELQTKYQNKRNKKKLLLLMLI